MIRDGKSNNRNSVAFHNHDRSNLTLNLLDFSLSEFSESEGTPNVAAIEARNRLKKLTKGKDNRRNKPRIDTPEKMADILGENLVNIEYGAGPSNRPPLQNSSSNPRPIPTPSSSRHFHRIRSLGSKIRAKTSVTQVTTKHFLMETIPKILFFQNP
jgi:hypothetical protein